MTEQDKEQPATVLKGNERSRKDRPRPQKAELFLLSPEKQVGGTT